jgi:glutathione S-transferase
VCPLSCIRIRSPEYRAVVPLGKLPAALVWDAPPAVADSVTTTPSPPPHPPLVLMESEVINEWLEERFPPPHHPALLPNSPAERAMVRWNVSWVEAPGKYAASTAADSEQPLILPPPTTHTGANDLPHARPAL